MAVPRKGWRPLALNEQTYYWRANGQDWGIEVVIVTGDAFISGARAQQLVFTLDYDHLRTPHPGGSTSLQQRAAVSPGIIRSAIEYAIVADPPFIGTPGGNDISLPVHAVAALQDHARLDVTPRESPLPKADD